MTVTGVGTVPNAPSNVSATPGASNIVVSWTDNSTNETGFDLQRYDADDGWIDIAPNIASSSGSGSLITYTDSTAANDGTAYLYQVAAYNASGDSDYDATTCAVAIPIAYEGFNYASVNGTNPFNGGNTGVGFAGGWSLTNSSTIALVSGSLTYSNSGHALTTSANSIQLGNSPDPTATQTLATTVGTANSILWIGLEFSVYHTGTAAQPLSAEVDIGSSTNNVSLGGDLQRRHRRRSHRRRHASLFERHHRHRQQYHLLRRI